MSRCSGVYGQVTPQPHTLYNHQRWLRMVKAPKLITGWRSGFVLAMTPGGDVNIAGSSVEQLRVCELIFEPYERGSHMARKN
jgi:hypothetical protein